MTNIVTRRKLLVGALAAVTGAAVGKSILLPEDDPLLADIVERVHTEGVPANKLPQLYGFGSFGARIRIVRYRDGINTFRWKQGTHAPVSLLPGDTLSISDDHGEVIILEAT